MLSILIHITLYFITWDLWYSFLCIMNIYYINMMNILSCWLWLMHKIKLTGAFYNWFLLHRLIPLCYRAEMLCQKSQCLLLVAQASGNKKKWWMHNSLDFCFLSCFFISTLLHTVSETVGHYPLGVCDLLKRSLQILENYIKYS